MFLVCCVFVVYGIVISLSTGSVAVSLVRCCASYSFCQHIHLLVLLTSLQWMERFHFVHSYCWLGVRMDF